MYLVLLLNKFLEMILNTLEQALFDFAIWRLKICVWRLFLPFSHQMLRTTNSSSGQPKSEARLSGICHKDNLDFFLISSTAFAQCVVPENIHTPTIEGIEIPEARESKAEFSLKGRTRVPVVGYTRVSTCLLSN